MKIDILIDKLTPCLVEVATGKVVTLRELLPYHWESEGQI